MNSFEETLENFLETLSCAQVSIDQTANVILGNLPSLSVTLHLLTKFIHHGNDEKSSSILYLIHDILNKISSAHDRNKIAHLLLKNYKYFRSSVLVTILKRLLKIWGENEIFPSETLRKLNKITESGSDKKMNYSPNQVLSYLKLFYKRKEFIDEKSKQYADSENVLLKDRVKINAEITEMKEEIAQCKLQKNSLSDLTNSFTVLLESARNQLKNYRNYRDQMIQLRWKVENIKQKIINAKTDQHEKMIKESFEVKDMEIESLSLESESLAGDKKSEIKNIENLKKSENVKSKSPDYVEEHRSIQALEMQSPMLDVQDDLYDEPLPAPTVYEYNHGHYPTTQVVQNTEPIPPFQAYPDPYAFVPQFQYPQFPLLYPQLYDPYYQMTVDPLQKFREL